MCQSYVNHERFSVTGRAARRRSSKHAPTPSTEHEQRSEEISYVEQHARLLALRRVPHNKGGWTL